MIIATKILMWLAWFLIVIPIAALVLWPFITAEKLKRK